MLSPSTSNVVLSLPNPKQLEAGEFDLDELVKKLTEVLAEDSQRNEILQLTGEVAALVIECLDKVISSDAFRAIPDIQARSRIFSTVSRLSRSCQYLPLSYWIDPRTITLPNEPYTSGTCAQVYRGTHKGESVAVKVLRTSLQENTAKLKKRFCKEAIIWKHVSCPYILKFNGVFYHNGLPAVVSPWMSHGNITEYLEKHPGVDRLRLFVGVVKGVRYLHNCNVAHGDIKGPNIFISDSTPPRPMLADFGFTRVTTLSTRMSSEEPGTMSFMAPELLHPRFGLDKGVPSKEADVYALGMTVYQVLTGRWPFYPKREVEAMHIVITGGRPLKPDNAEEIGMTEVVWELLGECWREDRTKRPPISEILARFCKLTGEGQTTDSVVTIPRLNIAGNRNSMMSGDPSLTTALSPRLPDTVRSSSSFTTVTVPSTSFDSLPEEIPKAKKENPIKDDSMTKKNRSAIWTNLLGQKLHAGRTTVEGELASPTETPGCVAIHSHPTDGARTRSKGKRRLLLDRVNGIVRFMFR